jgi:hypothetical protein
MSPNNVEEFENDLSQFFNDNLGNYTNWVATLSTQSKLTSRQRRRLGEQRHLQTNNNSSTPPLTELVPLETRSFVTSDNDNIDDIDAFDALLRETMNRNSTGFTLLLRSSSTIANQVYFARIENVEAVTFERSTEMPSESSEPNEGEGTLEPTETLPPSSAEADGWTAGAMAGKCVLVMDVIFASSGVAILCSF